MRFETHVLHNAVKSFLPYDVFLKFANWQCYCHAIIKWMHLLCLEWTIAIIFLWLSYVLNRHSLEGFKTQLRTSFSMLKIVFPRSTSLVTYQNAYYSIQAFCTLFLYLS